MKQLLVLAVTVILLSCEKELPKPDNITAGLPKPDNIAAESISALSTRYNVTDIDVSNPFFKPIFGNVRSEHYHGFLYDDCDNEKLIIDATATYYLKETRSEHDYHILYLITMTNATATGETSGRVYHGGGTSLSETMTHDDFLRMDTTYEETKYTTIVHIDSVFETTLIYGQDDFKRKFTSPHHSITFNKRNEYKEVNHLVVIDDTGNPLVIACRNF